MKVAQGQVIARKFPANLEAVGDAEAWISNEARRLGLSCRAEFAINLCVEELFVNAVLHGGAREASLTIERGHGPAKVEFVDDGASFDPTNAPSHRIDGPTEEFQIGGYGAGLVRVFAREMRYRRVSGRNIVTLLFDPEPMDMGGEAATK